MSPVITSIDPATGGVMISWSPPNNNGDPITAYKVEILENDGITWIENTTVCDGANPTVMALDYCIV